MLNEYLDIWLTLAVAVIGGVASGGVVIGALRARILLYEHWLTQLRADVDKAHERIDKHLDDAAGRFADLAAMRRRHDD